MEPRRARNPSTKAVAAVFAAGILYAGGGALACVYHNPSDVARGVMNFVYPKSLYVRSAVWQAQNTGLLPPRPARRAKELFAYQRITVDLRKLGEALGPAAESSLGFTVVLLDTMLWTHYATADGRFAVSVHVDGPKKGDAVLVTESEVIRALNAGALSFDVAETAGLVRVYGPADKQARARAVLRNLPVDAHAQSSRRAKGASG
ncbi:hypothetical protein AUC68_13935 [Methyloceanibacter methanicus]|uniref:Uncharacterized protein n=1 Tax=Methyloceanibacter methanicus TaxID=1774968 RepID=A0A1E3W4F1_9HYPH|nr:hypothetical protein [Methyloceanibacter methanicus]ODS00688.1 hypothetical protein AUC68_13935 [Methyloceanibacter methanicus]